MRIDGSHGNAQFTTHRSPFTITSDLYLRGIRCTITYAQPDEHNRETNKLKTHVNCMEVGMHSTTRTTILLFFALLMFACRFPGQEPTPTPTLTDITETTWTNTPEPTETLIPSPTPTETAIPETSTPAPLCPPHGMPTQPGWDIYCNETFAFALEYPPGAVFTETDINAAKIDLPFVPATNLQEKYMEILAQLTDDPCFSPYDTQNQFNPSESEQVVINGLTFFKQSNAEGAVGNIYEWISYSTGKDGLCISLSLILHSTQPMNYPTPPPVFDHLEETADFETIISTFRWLGP